MNILKYIVPLYGSIDNYKCKEFIGTAFIVKPNILITAGHNIKDYNSYSINFNQTNIKLSKPKYIEFEPNYLNDGDYKDLAIFYIDFKFDKGFSLEAKTFQIAEEFEMFGFDQNTHNKGKEYYSKKVTINYPNCSYKVFLKLVEFNNCINLNENVKKGNSGCPIFIDNKVYGMIVYGPVAQQIHISDNSRGASALKSEYIIKIIDNL